MRLAKVAGDNTVTPISDDFSDLCSHVQRCAGNVQGGKARRIAQVVYLEYSEARLARTGSNQRRLEPCLVS